MSDPFLPLEEEIRRESQELAVAWRRGRAARVLETLAGRHPLRAALVAVLVYDSLSKWDPVQGKWPLSFWRAVLARSAGCPAIEELYELQGRYRRRFGCRPPETSGPGLAAGDRDAMQRSLEAEANRIRRALAEDEPIPRRRALSPPPAFLRRRRRA